MAELGESWRDRQKHIEGAGNEFAENYRKGEEVAANIVRDGLKMLALINSGAIVSMPAIVGALFSGNAAVKAALIWPMAAFVLGLVMACGSIYGSCFAMCYHIDANRENARLYKAQVFEVIYPNAEVKSPAHKSKVTRNWRIYSRIRVILMFTTSISLLAFISGAGAVFWMVSRTPATGLNN